MLDESRIGEAMMPPASTWTDDRAGALDEPRHPLVPLQPATRVQFRSRRNTPTLRYPNPTFRARGRARARF
jgi:hypothetical protein